MRVNDLPSSYLQGLGRFQDAIDAGAANIELPGDLRRTLSCLAKLAHLLTSIDGFLPL